MALKQEQIAIGQPSNLKKNEFKTLTEYLHDNDFYESIEPGDSACIKPFIQHNFCGEGKLLILRIGGKISGDPQRELSIVGRENTERAINETMQWFDSKGKN